MDPRRPPRAVSDPKVRQVGFFASPDPIASSSSPVSNSPSGNSLSPVMIPPPRHSSDTSRPVLFPAVPASTARRESVLVESYNNSSEPFPASPPTASSSYGIVMGNGEFLNDVVMSPGRTFRRVRAAGGLTTSSSFPSGGFDLTAAVKASSVPASGLMTVSVVKMPSGISEKDVDASTEVQSERAGNSKPLKEKTTKAERRALQEAQRAAKAAAKAANVKPPKATKLVSQSSVAVSEKKGGGGGGGSERPPEKERKKEVPHPRMQYDDKSRVEKAKRRSVVKQTEARNRVELFRHLPQYEHGTQLPDLESKFFQLDPVHPAVYKVIVLLAGDPDVILKVPGREEVNPLDGHANCENLQPLNLIYDALPSDYISMIITDYGMVSPFLLVATNSELASHHDDSWLMRLLLFILIRKKTDDAYVFVLLLGSAHKRARHCARIQKRTLVDVIILNSPLGNGLMVREFSSKLYVHAEISGFGVSSL
ncbi:unnamed protein product [Malus baccata var. baccata]